MKISLLLLFLNFTFFGLLAQVEIPTNESGRAEFDIIVEKVGTQDELFQKGRTWVHETYNSGKAVIQYDDKEIGEIFGKAKTKQLTYVNMGMKKNGGYFDYDIKLMFKDGKYRLLLNNIIYQKGEIEIPSGADFAEEYPSNWPSFGKKIMKKQWDTMKEEAFAEFNLVVESLKRTMASSDSDW